MSALSTLERRVFPDTPPARLAALRVLVGLFSTIYLVSRPTGLAFFGQFARSAFAPVGVVQLLVRPLPSAACWALYGITLAASAAATAGYRYRVSGPLWALGLLWVTSYRNSWGMLFHTENLLVVDALILALAPASDAWSLDARSRDAKPLDPNPKYAWPVAAMNAALVASYLAAAIAKLRLVGWGWASGDELRAHIAFDALRKIELGSMHSSIGAELVRHPWIFAPFAWLSLGFELAAPVALLGGRIALIWSLGAWTFHLGVLLLMAIFFPYPLTGVAFASLFPIERAFSRWFEGKQRAVG
jgi:hypothetical protein